MNQRKIVALLLVWVPTTLLLAALAATIPKLVTATPFPIAVLAAFGAATVTAVLLRGAVLTSRMLAGDDERGATR